MIKQKNFYVTILLLVLFSYYTSTVLAWFGYHKRRRSSRACFANQKTIAGAIEMYNLDYSVHTKKLTPELFQTLSREGYLQSIPRHPGDNKLPSSTYILTEDGAICCLKDGFIQPPQGSDLSSSPFEQLKTCGEKRKHILSRASHKPANSMGPKRDLMYSTTQTAGFLFSTGFLLFMVWFPLSIWRLRKWRYGHKIKLMILVLFAVVACVGPYNIRYNILIVPIILSPILLMLDLLFFGINLLFGESCINNMAVETKTRISMMNKATQDKIRNIITDASNRYQKSAGLMAMVSAVAILPVIPWIFLGRYNFEKTLVFLIAAAVVFIGGAVTGTVRFVDNITAANSLSGSDETNPGTRTFFTGLLFLAPLLNCGQSLTQTSLTCWAISVWPLLILTSFFGGRSIAIARLGKKFVVLLGKSVLNSDKPACQTGPLLKQIRTTGMSAHPGRRMSSTTSKTSAISVPVAEPQLFLPMPEAKLSLREATCPVCGEGFADREAWLCDDCDTPHHSDCWKFNGTCTTFGCNSRSASIQH